MAGYGLFAQVYDSLTENVPYDEIAEYYHGKIQKFRDGEGGFLADAGCGTGNLTARMAAKGYDVIGADASPDMLSEAMNKPHDGVQYICQGMTGL
ncbi:MAG TPA: class I SAM-dependent methyltransferase, partial [Ruminococcaceae bacterium]|nr:class I SAM-dependent methyltransferase [Oscillospiraceae bacterium]